MDDFANLCVFLMNNYSGRNCSESWVNAGTGKELTIKALTELVAKMLEDGIRLAYKDFLENPIRAER